MRVTVYSTKAFEKRMYAQVKHPGIEWDFTTEALSHKTVDLAAGSEAVALFSNDDASAPVLERLYAQGTMYVALRSAGYDHVSLEKAQELGIKVAHVPAYSPHAIAEHALMLMMALNRRLLVARQQQLKHDFTLDNLVGFNMHGKTAGIIGTGRIGSAMAHIMNGLGCHIIACDPFPDNKLSQDCNLQYVDLNTLYGASDIITLHCPLNRFTRFMINGTSIAQMKRGVMLINTARGAIVNTADAWAGLESGQIGYLGLDVYENEKGIFFGDRSKMEWKDVWIDKLLHHPRCILTGHQAFLTDTAIQNMAETTVNNITCWIENRKCENELKTETYTLKT